MINVDQITSRLAKLPDQALQQYAAMHKNDPYIMALAVSESNRRKATRQAAQSAQPGMEPPKVADQALADMAPQELPEDQGIAQLPVGDMNFASGGIVAFAGGGDVERYQFGGSTLPSGSTEFAIPGMTLPSRSFVPTTPGAPPPGEAAIQAAIAAAEAQSMRFSGRPLSDAQKQTIRARFAEDYAGAAKTMVPTAPAPAAVRQAAPVTPVAAPSAPLAPGRKPPPTGQRPSAPSAPAAAPAAPAAPAPTQGGLGDLQSLYAETLKKQEYKDPAAKELTSLESEERAAVEAEKAAIERDQAKFAEAFKGRESRLAARETDIGKQKDVNTGLSFLNAGLAIMSTPGGLATAIGKGARVGTEQFAAGLDKIRSAQERLDDARDKLEDLRLNRDEMSAKELRAAESKIRQVGIDAKKRGIDGLRQAAGVTEKRAETIFGKAVLVGTTQEEIAGRERVANIAAAASREGAGATREAANQTRIAVLLENTRKNISAEAATKFPFDAVARAQYEQQAFNDAVRQSPVLAQYLGVAGGGGAPAAAPTMRFNPATGKIEPMR